MIYWVLAYLVCVTKKLFNTTRPVSGRKTILKENDNNLLGYYLAGLIEGDGSIILRKGIRVKTSPKVVFTFHPNELPLYKKLSQILQSGIIYTEKRGVCRYTISNANAVIKLINLVYGKFRTPKLVALDKAIDNLNKGRNANLIKMPIDTGNLSDNP